jgi:hypothetical protein
MLADSMPFSKKNGELFPVYAGIQKIRHPSDPKK